MIDKITTRDPQFFDLDLAYLLDTLDSQDEYKRYSDEAMRRYRALSKRDPAKAALFREHLPFTARNVFKERLAEHQKVNGTDVDIYPRTLDLVALAKTEPNPPPFIIPDWLPEGEVTLFASHGGAGKSYIALYLAVCIALGLEFFGLSTERRCVAFYACEDKVEILHWRLSRICLWLNVDIASLAGWLTIWDQSHADAALMTDAREGLQFTALHEWVRDNLGEAQLLVVDGASDAFDGDEIKRRQVRRFVRELRRLIPDDGAVLLLAHVNAQTARNAETLQAFSGSTAWHNSVRARWYLRPVADSDDLRLETQKGNHAEGRQSITLHWNKSAHLFLADVSAPAPKLDRELVEADERAAILAAMLACAKSAAVVPAAANGPRTAFHVLSVRPEFPKSLLAGKPGIRRFWQQIERLRAMGAICESSIRRSDRHYVRQLVVATEEVRTCGQ